mgnify:CR=1 FL=1
MWAKIRKSGQYGIWRHNCEYCPIIDNDLVKMISLDCKAGIRACIPKFSSNLIAKNFVLDEPSFDDGISLLNMFIVMGTPEPIHSSRTSFIHVCLFTDN